MSVLNLGYIRDDHQPYIKINSLPSVIVHKCGKMKHSLNLVSRVVAKSELKYL